jgi:hypothetical protein
LSSRFFAPNLFDFLYATLFRRVTIF